MAGRHDPVRPGLVRALAPRVPGRLGRVLLAEDDPAVAGPLAAALRQAGFCVIVAVNGQAALSLLRAQRFDLVVTEIVLPKTDGLELLRWLRGAQAHVPAIALSGDGPGDALYAKAARCFGADATVAKPVAPATVLVTAHRLVAQGRGSAGAQTQVSAA